MAPGVGPMPLPTSRPRTTSGATQLFMPAPPPPPPSESSNVASTSATTYEAHVGQPERVIGRKRASEEQRASHSPAPPPKTPRLVEAKSARVSSAVREGTRETDKMYDTPAMGVDVPSSEASVSRSARSSGAGENDLASKTVEELRLLLQTSLENKDSVMEKLMDLMMGGEAAFGVDPAFLRMQKEFLATRIQQIKAEIAVRANNSIPRPSTAHLIEAPSDPPHARPPAPLPDTSRFVTAATRILAPNYSSDSNLSSSRVDSPSVVAAARVIRAPAAHIPAAPVPTSNSSRSSTSVKPVPLQPPPLQQQQQPQAHGIVLEDYDLPDLDEEPDDFFDEEVEAIDKAFDDTDDFIEEIENPSQQQQRHQPAPPAQPQSKHQGAPQAQPASYDEFGDMDELADFSDDDVLMVDEDVLMAGAVVNQKGKGKALPAATAPAQYARHFDVDDDDDDDDDDDFQIDEGRSVVAVRPPGSSASRKTTHDEAHPDGDDSITHLTSVVQGEQRLKKPSLARNQMNRPWSRDVAGALKTTFKLHEFRNNQLEAINATLAGNDVFCLMPTGGGKSLCYQLPAMIDSGKTRGVTVVISPLISLIHDQVRHLLDRDVPVVKLTGDMTQTQRDFVMAELFKRDDKLCTRMMYVTPEFIAKSPKCAQVFEYLHRHQRLARFVIDEAHCVSQWGHDFRPDYQELGSLRRNYPGIPVMALTATATERVKLDIVSNLGIKGCKTFEQSFNRPNLHYQVRKKTNEVLQDMAHFIRSQHAGECGVIYCSSRKTCEEVADKLTREYHVAAEHYHAGLGKADRIAVQERWQSGDFKVIVATIAFGMGIDKPDVRFVLHHTLPQSLEGLYQESGRAGRDGKSSTCILYFRYADTNYMRQQIQQNDSSHDQKEQQYANLRQVVAYCMNQIDCRRSQVLQYFGEVFPAENCHHTCDNCVEGRVNANRTGGALIPTDVTKEAQDAVKLVRDMTRDKRDRVTLLQAADVFRGAMIKRVIDRGQDKIQGFGAGGKLPRGDAERLLQLLVIEGYLAERTEVSLKKFTHSYVQAGPNADKLLKGRAKVEMPMTNAARQNPNAAAGVPAPKRRPVKARAPKNLQDSDFEYAHDPYDISTSTLTIDGEEEEIEGDDDEPRPGPAKKTPVSRVKKAAPPPKEQTTRTRKSKQTAEQEEDLISSWEENYNGQPQAAAGTSAAATGNANTTQVVETCYSELVKIRKKHGDRQSTVPAKLMDDATLQEVALLLPKTFTELTEIDGVDGKNVMLCREILQVTKRFSAAPVVLSRYAFQPTSNISSPAPSRAAAPTSARPVAAAVPQRASTSNAASPTSNNRPPLGSLSAQLAAVGGGIRAMPLPPKAKPAPAQARQ